MVRMTELVIVQDAVHVISVDVRFVKLRLVLSSLCPMLLIRSLGLTFCLIVTLLMRYVCWNELFVAYSVLVSF